MIVSPTSDISEEEKTELLDYLEAGGKAMIFSDYTQDDLPNFDAVLENYGVSVQRESYLRVIISIMECKCHIILYQQSTAQMQALRQLLQAPMYWHRMHRHSENR